MLVAMVLLQDDMLSQHPQFQGLALLASQRPEDKSIGPHPYLLLPSW